MSLACVRFHRTAQQHRHSDQTGTTPKRRYEPSRMSSCMLTLWSLGQHFHQYLQVHHSEKVEGMDEQSATPTFHRSWHCTVYINLAPQHDFRWTSLPNKNPIEAQSQAEAETKPKRVRSNDLPFIKKKSKDPKIETKDIYQPAHAS